MSEIRNPGKRTITTARLTLEPNGTAHSEELWRSASESMKELRPWLFWTASASLDEVARWGRICELNWAENKAWVFAILFEGRPIGTVGIEEPDVQTLRAEIGYWMHTGYSGRGLMTEAGRAVVDFGFDELGLHRLQLEAGKDNAPSIRVAEKLGFQREGLAREACRGALGFYDAYRFGLLASDPRKVDPQ